MTEIQHNQKNREKVIDIMKGLLILFVVIGHSNIDKLYKDIIFCFHMPLFFIVSGYLLKCPNEENYIVWIKKQFYKFFIPYVFWFIVCDLFLYKHISILWILRFIWGGKMLPGVYWFITVLFLSELLLCYIIFLTNRKKQFVLIGLKLNTTFLIYCCFFIIAILYSYYLIPLDKNIIPLFMKFPWDIDVCLLAVCYLALGYYNRNTIKYVITNTSSKTLLLFLFAIAILLTIFSFSEKLIIVDMKNSIYFGGILLLVVPCCCFYIFCIISRVIKKTFLGNLFAHIGQNTLIIMYIHLAIRDFFVIPVFGKSYYWLYYIFIVLFVCEITLRLYSSFKRIFHYSI